MGLRRAAARLAACAKCGMAWRRIRRPTPRGVAPCAQLRPRGPTPTPDPAPASRRQHRRRAVSVRGGHQAVHGRNTALGGGGASGGAGRQRGQGTRAARAGVPPSCGATPPGPGSQPRWPHLCSAHGVVRPRAQPCRLLFAAVCLGTSAGAAQEPQDAAAVAGRRADGAAGPKRQGGGRAHGQGAAGAGGAGLQPPTLCAGAALIKPTAGRRPGEARTPTPRPHRQPWALRAGDAWPCPAQAVMSAPPAVLRPAYLPACPPAPAGLPRQRGAVGGEHQHGAAAAAQEQIR